jgi:diacylglycerol kinase family enzyme
MQISWTQPTDDYAVVLNANAGRVTPQLVGELRHLVPEGKLYLTQSQLHARDVIRECVNKETPVIFAGGGDGTIVDTINSLHEFRGGNNTMPAVGALKLGTGNALAHWLDAPKPAQALHNWKAGETHKLLSLRMVEAEDTLFPFAGLGIDAAILNDYYSLKQNTKSKWYEPMGKGLFGYLVAGHLTTLPNYIKRPKTEVRIINLGSTAYQIGADGQEIGKGIQSGQVIYEGPSSMVGCANTPYYGYQLKMFPYASQQSNRFQLRVINMNAGQMAYNIWPAWNGNVQHPNLHDFYADRVRVVFKDAMPYQLGGEAAGYRKEITFSLAQQPISMIGQA